MATFTPAVKSVCLETRPLVLLLILINVISDGTCQNISLSCPLLQEGSVTKFDCSVRKSMCNHSTVSFQFESKNKEPSILCNTSSSSPCDQQQVAGKDCGCVSSNSTLRYYQLNISGDKAKYDGGNLTCNANCVPIPNAAVCQPLTFALPSTSSSTTTVVSALPSTSTSTTSVTPAGSGNTMHVFRTGIVASMSGIFAFISTHVN